MTTAEEFLEAMLIVCYLEGSSPEQGCTVEQITEGMADWRNSDVRLSINQLTTAALHIDARRGQ